MKKWEVWIKDKSGQYTGEVWHFEAVNPKEFLQKYGYDPKDATIKEWDKLEGETR